MPEFLGEFGRCVEGKKEALKAKVFQGTPNPLAERFSSVFPSLWNTIDRPANLSGKIGELNVMAVDSSVYSNLLSTGGVFYVVRSLGVCRDFQQKWLESDVFFSRGGSVAEREYLTVKMELAEFQVALEALKSGLGCSTILIDGSLYGRLVHLPLESKVEEDRLILLDYFRVYRQLFDACRQSGVTLVGVAKESRSTAFRDYLLSLVFGRALEEAELEDDDVRMIRPLFMEVADDASLGLQRFQRFKQKYGGKVEVVGLVLEELARARPDYQVIMRYARTLGYTQPLLLGASPRLERRLRQFQSHPEDYVKKNFPNAIREMGKRVIDEVAGVIAGIADFPAILSFYVLFDLHDSPIRIDIPCYDKRFVDVGWHKPFSADLSGVLKVLATGYCGLDCHNLWLKNVDERVRLKKKTVDNIYVPYLERLFGEKIIRGRSYRRVKYP
ncbi:MAG: DNA double-strand break repair nuclease NurA [Candidatus Bathyarchaeota archaeon]|nr:DNA double-strand break repair nuclease NurA [Candidatus Bathyarchaeota archaeon]